MSRLRRRVISSRRVSVRYVETKTRKQARQVMDELLETMIEQWRTQLLDDHGIILTDDMITARSLKVSSATPVYEFSDTELLGYRYDITALI